MAGQNGITNGVHDGVNSASKAKTLPKSFDSIEDTIAAFGILAKIPVMLQAAC
jgi:hypothetical protein